MPWSLAFVNIENAQLQKAQARVRATSHRKHRNLLDPDPRPILSTGDFLLLSLLASLPGALLGYVFGGLISVVLLMLDILGNLRTKPKGQR
jgi:hypothetical protein